MCLEKRVSGWFSFRCKYETSQNSWKAVGYHCWTAKLVKSSPLLPVVQQRKQLKYGETDSVVVFLIMKGHCSASSSPFFWRELQESVSGKEKYYTRDKKYCKALGRQRKHLVTSEELHGYNPGQSLTLTAFICISLHSVQYAKWLFYLHGSKSRVSLLKTTAVEPMGVIQIDASVNDITLWPQVLAQSLVIYVFFKSSWELMFLHKIHLHWFGRVTVVCTSIVLLLLDSLHL